MAEADGAFSLPPVNGAVGHVEPNGASAKTFAATRQQLSDRAGTLHDDLAQPDGTLPVSQLSDLLGALDIDSRPDNYTRVLQSLCGNAESLSKDQTLALVGVVASSPAQPSTASVPWDPDSRQRPPSAQQRPQSADTSPASLLLPPGPGGPGPPAAPQHPLAQQPLQLQPIPSQQQQQQPVQQQSSLLRFEASAGGGGGGGGLQGGGSGPQLAASPSIASEFSSPARPFRRLLTRNRAYLETGYLQVDEAVLSYMAKLEEHRRRCEGEGRYQEAKVAARRLADLRTAQVERLRGELAATQARELEEVAGVYEEEAARFHAAWEARMREYGAAVVRAVEEVKAAHGGALVAFAEELQRKRPQRARPSRDYLQHREVQDKLAKAQLYSRATQVKSMADELYLADFEATVAAWEAESKLKIAKLQARQQTEYEALQQRCAKGRDELELKRVAESERRTLRFRNIVMELEQLHKLEMAHLECFADGQVLAGKAAPLRDPGAFRRRREQLYSTALS